jgi:hypothetical protein
MSALTFATRRRTARGLLLLLFGVWALVASAPCVMAAPTCHDMNTSCPQAGGPDCDTLQTADCQTQDAVFLLSADNVPDFTTLPPRLFLQPQVAWLPPRLTGFPQTEQFALRLDPPPLYLQHSVFLI